MHDLHLTAAILVGLFAGLAFFDGVYLHLWRYKLYARPESVQEHRLHTMRAWLFPLWLYLLFGVQLRGWPLLAAFAIAGLDLFIQLLDMWEERPAREQFGGLSRGEYILHVWLTALHTGALLVTALARPLSDFGFDRAQWLAPHPAGDTITFLLLPGAVLLALLHQVLLLPRFRASAARSEVS